METNQTLGDMLKNVGTQEGKAAVIAAMIGKPGVPQELIERTFNFYTKRKEYAKAHALAQKAGMRQKVRDLEQMASSYEEKEEDEELITDDEEEEAKRVISSYKNAGEYASIELGLKTIEALSLLGREDDAAAVAVNHGIYTKAIELKEKRKKWKDAAEIAEQNALYERAAINYERAEDFGKAGDSFVAEVAARKDKRKKSQNVVVAFVSQWTNFYTGEEQNIFIRAVENYTRANWKESVEDTLKKVTDKRKVYAYFETKGDFAKAEEYAALVGDRKQEQVYRGIDLNLNHQRGIEQRQKEKDQREKQIQAEREQQQRRREAAKERERRQERQKEMAAIKASLETKIQPLVGEASWKYATEVTVLLYEACRDSAEIVCRAHKIPFPEAGNIADTLETEFVNKKMLEKEYAKTMRTMYNLKKLISDDQIRGVEEKTYYIYRKDAKRFVNEMGRLAYGAMGSDANIAQQSKTERTTKRAAENGLVNKVYNSLAWSSKEMLSCAAGESAYYYVKKYVLVPAILSLGLLGRCAYLDAAVTTMQPQVVQSAIVSQAVSETRVYSPLRGCFSESDRDKIQQTKIYDAGKTDQSSKEK